MHNVMISEGYLIAATSNCRSKLQQFKLTIHCYLIYGNTSNKNMQLVSKHGHKTSWLKNDVARFTTDVKTSLTTTTKFLQVAWIPTSYWRIIAPLWAVPNKASLVDLLDAVFFFNQAHILSQFSSLHFNTIIVDLLILDSEMPSESERAIKAMANAHQQQCRRHFG